MTRLPRPFRCALAVALLLAHAAGCGDQSGRPNDGGNADTGSDAAFDALAPSIDGPQKDASEADPACLAQCERAAACGVDLCAEDRPCQGPNAACLASCLAPASCEELQSLAGLNPSGALLRCIGSCSSSPGSGTECLYCQLDQCRVERVACAANADCASWLRCANGCDAAGCYADCDELNPGAAPLTGPIYQCGCTKCSTCVPTFDTCPAELRSPQAAVEPWTTSGYAYPHRSRPTRRP